MHAAHSGREFRVLNVQFHIGWERTDMALGAQVVGTRDSGQTHDGPHRLGSEFLVLGMVAAATRQLALIWRRGRKLKQFG
jgi:hypothetical protein